MDAWIISWVSFLTVVFQPGTRALPGVHLLQFDYQGYQCALAKEEAWRWKHECCHLLVAAVDRTLNCRN
jgi:hypothetical protein